MMSFTNNGMPRRDVEMITRARESGRWETHRGHCMRCKNPAGLLVGVNWGCSLRNTAAMPNGGTGSNPSSRRPSLRPPSPGADAPVAGASQPRRGSRVLFDTKTPPSILRWEILNRVLALSVKGDWPAVDQHLISLGRNNMEISSTEIEVKMILLECTERLHEILLVSARNRFMQNHTLSLKRKTVINSNSEALHLL